MNLKKISDTLLPDILRAIPLQNLKFTRISTPHSVKVDSPELSWVTYSITNGIKKVVVSFDRLGRGHYYINGKQETVANINAILIKLFRTK